MRTALIAWMMFIGSPVLAQEIPSWFSESLLHLPDDVAEAAREGKRVMLYFHQDGCPYCKRLVEVNWRDPRIEEKMRARFVSLAINIWGDREVTWTDGTQTTEKRLAATLKVQFTPTLVFLDGKGAIARRINGYYPPREFEAAIDDVSARQAGTPGALPARGKPLAMVFEASPELRRALGREEVRQQLARFDLVEARAGDAMAKELGITRAPTMVLFDNSGREVLRLEAYFRPFHIAGSLEYVSSGAYRSEPSFQRFLQAKAEAMRRRGEKVDLWR
jgi:thioredoxin-related protein